MHGRSSFRSYAHEDSREQERKEKLEKAYSAAYEIPEMELKNRLLQGEIVLGCAKKVIKYNAVNDTSKGITGNLVCTNFRLSFNTAEETKYDLIELQNRLLYTNEITLNNVDSIYVEYPNKRKKLIPGSRVKDGIKSLEVHCKDFRIISFNFKLTIKGEEKSLISSLLYHAYPATANLLFALDYQHQYDIKKECKVPLYRDEQSWKILLQECNLSKHWRVTSCNSDLTVSGTMSKYFVVPNTIKDAELREVATKFQNDRLPMWCWGDTNGCSLVRSAQLRPDIEQKYGEDRLFEAVKSTDPKHRPYDIIEIDKICPSCAQIQQSFRKLKNLCMPTSAKEFWEIDSRWYDALYSSKWLLCVSMVLSASSDAASIIRDKGHHVILRESSGVDLTPAVSSLVQLILDPLCRTVEGFQSLIQREWVVAGHPFLDRLGHLLQPTKKSKQTTAVVEGETTKLAPIFLLFLDCVYQLIRQFPSRFEFNSTFLIVLHDSTKVSAFETFLFNNELQRRRCSANAGKKSTLLPLWCWRVQFTDMDMTLFNNPLYKLRMSEDYCMNSETSRQLFSPSVSPKKPMRRAPDPPPTSKKPPPLPNQQNPSTSLTPNSKPPVAPPRTRPKNIKVTSFSTDDYPESTSSYPPSPGSPRLKQKQVVDIESKQMHNHARKEHQRNKSEDISKIVGRHTKIALVPKGASLERQEQPHTPPMRSKSEGNLFDEEEDEVIEIINEVKIEEVPTKTKKKGRFSFRRKRSKDYGSNEELLGEISEYKVNLSKITTLEREGSFVFSTVKSSLYPCTNVSGLKLWRECYMRWIPWSQLYGGGPAAMWQQQSIIFDEVHILNNKIRELKMQLQESPVHTESCHRDYDQSGMYFCMHPSGNDSVFATSPNLPRSNSILSSYFPYSPIKDIRSKSVLGTPLSNFLQGGSLFNFGRLRTKHVNSDISNPVSTSEEIENSTSGHLTPSGASGVSLDNITYESWGTEPSKSSVEGPKPPSNPPQPPSALLKPTYKENITYITSL